jgi:hypothetical protein
MEDWNTTEMENDRGSPDFDLCMGQGGIVELYNKARQSIVEGDSTIVRYEIVNSTPQGASPK